MPVIMFQPRFERLILDGVKKTTIRENARCSAGDPLSLRTWMDKPYRSKQREFLSTSCLYVERIEIRDVGVWLWRHGMPVNGHPEFLPASKHADELAITDGFTCFQEMTRWFLGRKGIVAFTGDRITWQAPS